MYSIQMVLNGVAQGVESRHRTVETAELEIERRLKRHRAVLGMANTGTFLRVIDAHGNIAGRDDCRLPA